MKINKKAMNRKLIYYPYKTKKIICEIK